MGDSRLRPPGVAICRCHTTVDICVVTQIFTYCRVPTRRSPSASPGHASGREHGCVCYHRRGLSQVRDVVAGAGAHRRVHASRSASACDHDYPFRTAPTLPIAMGFRQQFVFTHIVTTHSCHPGSGRMFTHLSLTRLSLTRLSLTRLSLTRSVGRDAARPVRRQQVGGRSYSGVSTSTASRAAHSVSRISSWSAIACSRLIASSSSVVSGSSRSDCNGSN